MLFFCLCCYFLFQPTCKQNKIMVEYAQSWWEPDIKLIVIAYHENACKQPYEYAIADPGSHFPGYSIRSLAG